MQNFEIRFINLCHFETDAEIQANVADMMLNHTDIKAISAQIIGVLFIIDYEDAITEKMVHNCLLNGRTMPENINHSLNHYQDQLLNRFGADVAVTDIQSTIGQKLILVHHQGRSNIIQLQRGFDGPQITVTPDVVCPAI